MTFCDFRNTSDSFINLLNALMAVFAVAIMAAVGGTRLNMGDGVDEALEEGGIEVSYWATGSLVGMSILGCIALKIRNGWLLGIYLFFTVSLTCYITYGAATVTTFAYKMDDITEENLLDEDANFEAIAVEALLAIYTACCVNVFNTPAPVLCSSDNPGSCIIDFQRFEDILELVPQQICGDLATENVNGNPIVGNVSDGGCGQGNTEVFVDVLGDYLSDVLKPLGYAASVFALFLLIDNTILCVVFIQKRKEFFPCCFKTNVEDTDNQLKSSSKAIDLL